MTAVTTTRRIEINNSMDDSVLTCPRCGGHHMFHTMVAHHVREKEDGLSSVCYLPAQYVAPLGGNPSSRRGGVVISFECEQCGPGLELLISQHKGDTELGWRFTPAEARQSIFSSPQS